MHPYNDGVTFEYLKLKREVEKKEGEGEGILPRKGLYEGPL